MNKPEPTIQEEKREAKKDRILKLAMELVQEDNNQGICLSCEEVADCVEPDACGYECECCGKEQVYGAEQILLMLVR